MTNIRRQSTIKGPAMCAGIALHGGRHTRLAMRPAPINTGLIFIRTDVTDRDDRIIVSPEAVSDVTNCTTVKNPAGVTVATIEHLLAALAASGVDNLYMELDGPELPALDGSAEPFLKLIEQVGVARQEAPRRYVQVLKPIKLRRGQAFARLFPANRLELSVSIDFKDKAIGRQKVEITPDVRAFRERLASARTFARLHEVAALQAKGLSKGGSFDNAIVVDDDKILNPGGLRFDDEFVRHKALDLLGDLYLGGPILGRVETHASGHGLNHALLTALYSDPKAWRFVSMDQKTQLNPTNISPILQSISA